MAQHIWLCDLTHTYQTIAMNKMPLGIGMIAAYCKKEFKDNISIHLFKFLDELIVEVENGEPPIIVGFSNYVWNHRLSLEVSKRIKAKYPQTAIVFGGPELAFSDEERFYFLQNYPWIDFYIPLEGEEAFSNLIKLMLESDGDIEKVKDGMPKNLVFLKNDLLVKGEILPRIDLLAIPSPYLEGYFDKYFGKLIPMVQTTRGCPFCCAYCNDGIAYWCKITRRETQLTEELEYIAARCNNSDPLYITDANFGMYPQDIEVCKTIARLQDTFSWPWYISVNTGKNNKERIFEAAQITRGAMAVTAALQSTDPVVLKNVRRVNLPFEEIIKLAKETKKLSSRAGSNSDLILCLPGDTTRAHYQSIKDVIDSGIDEVTPFQFMLLPGTELATRESIEKYQMAIKYRVLPRCFGKYHWLKGEEDIITSEIEMICVANTTMAFVDYLDCRRLDLTVAMFYNHSILMDLYRVLNFFGISTFDFILKLQDCAMGSEMKILYDEFIRETRAELWDSSDDIFTFIQKPGVLEKYKSGEYGANLIFKYKTMALIQSMDYMSGLAYASAVQMISEKAKIEVGNVSNIFDFLKELEKFHRSLIIDFLNVDKSFEMESHHNIFEFNTQSLLFDMVKESMEIIKIEHTPEQKGIIGQGIERHGKNLIGISQMLSQIPLTKLLRTPHLTRVIAGLKP